MLENRDKLEIPRKKPYENDPPQKLAAKGNALLQH